MKKLKIAILWHQHQPYYRLDDKFILPWARLHAVKDYLDLPLLLHEFPNVKQTFNLAPSLLLQIEEYLNCEAKDIVQVLTELPAKDLSKKDKEKVLDYFFTCNYDNMISPYPRYKNLYEYSRDKDYAINNFTETDWIDIQTWYNLTWIGMISREIPAVKRLFKKGSNFTEKEKNYVLEVHNEIMSKIIPEMKLLKEMGQIEISCSPMFHPILPLLIDNKVAKECLPNYISPETSFSYPKDAFDQMRLGLEYYNKCFDENPAGVWPSEGSLSNQTLDILGDLGVKWAASDEKLLQAAKGDSFKHTDKYYPQKFISASSQITLLFRDHYLSDKIGFVYSGKHHDEAANDFIETLMNIKNDIIYNLGEQELDYTAIPIILDGENCWEFYKNNGIDFLRALFNRLENNNDIETITCSQAADLASEYRRLNTIKAGSWINADFSIWIGHEEDRKAWTYLAKARNEFEKIKDKLSLDLAEQIQYEFYIAEGSDWFWWYGPEFNAPNKPDFDVIFRKRLENIYKLMDLILPDYLNYPIGVQAPSSGVNQAKSRISPSIISNIENEEWEDAGLIDAKGSFSTMRQIGEILDFIRFGNDGEKLYLKIQTLSELTTSDKIVLELEAVSKIIITITGKASLEINSSSGIITILQTSFEEGICLAFANCYSFKGDSSEIKLSVRTYSGDLAINYPQSGYWGIKLID